MMKFEVGDICELRNGNLAIVERANNNVIWGIYCCFINSPNPIPYLYNIKGQYDPHGEKHKYDIVKILSKEEHPEYYI